MYLSNVKYIVAKGGGVKLFAHIGALQALSDKGVYQNLKGAAGTSAGAIIATLVSLKYSTEEIYRIVNGYNFPAFEDHTFISEIESLHNYGYCKGDVFLKAIKQAIKDRTKNENSTFADFKKLGMLDLKVFATAVDLPNTSVEFSYDKTPNVRVCEAVRASMSIPGIFVPATLTGSDQMYFDGGITRNYPITCFDTICGCTNDEVLGLFLYDTENTEVVPKLKRGHPMQFITQTFKAALDSQDENVLNDVVNLKRTVIIPTHGISATDFGIDASKKKLLYDSGYKAIT